MSDSNCLIRDDFVQFLLYDVQDCEELCQWSYFQDHSRETFDLYLDSIKRFSREKLYPTYRTMDEQPATFENGRMITHPVLKEIFPRLVELGIVAAGRPYDVGGQQLPSVVHSLANAYLMAANLSAVSYLGLTTGAAHLIEAFGHQDVKDRFLEDMYSGRWTGTMALTEPQAGSGLADVKTTAEPAGDGTYRIRGTKIFISGGDHDLTENIVHLTLARIKDAPLGTKGISLFAIPAKRTSEGRLLENDVTVSGNIHKIGWRGIPSLVLDFGDKEDCHGWLVGEKNRGLNHMFQMMNEARLMVGMHGAATASVAYQESLNYAKTRTQGRSLTNKDPSTPAVPLTEHADVRRMLLKQKAIVEGSFALLAETARLADEAEHHPDDAKRTHARYLLDLLTPVSKSFPAERGFESNALAVQILGGYGYTSEYLPESWLRDQKLNSIHEGTTGIQGLDLLGRKMTAGQGAALDALKKEIGAEIEQAHQASAALHPFASALSDALDHVVQATVALGIKGINGDTEGMLRHSTTYLDMMGVLLTSWQWLKMSRKALTKRAPRTVEELPSFEAGLWRAAQFWFASELPRLEHLSALCTGDDDSFGSCRPEWL